MHSNMNVKILIMLSYDFLWMLKQFLVLFLLNQMLAILLKPLFGLLLCKPPSANVVR